MKKQLLLHLLLAFAATGTFAQTIGDYQSRQTGNWATTSTWERWDGTSWITPAPTAPTYTDGIITIRSGHNVSQFTATVTADQIVVAAGGTLTLGIIGNNLTLNNGSGDEMDIFGTVIQTRGTINGAGTMLIEPGGHFNFGNGATSVGSVNSVTITNNGSIDWYNTYVGCCGNPIITFTSATLINNGTFSIYSAGNVSAQTLNGGTITNYGTIIHNYGTSLALNPVSFTNTSTGTVTNSAGNAFTISLSGSGTHDGAYITN